MAKKQEFITWSAFKGFVTVGLSLAVVVIGGGFAWLHTDLAELRSTTREIAVQTSNTRTDVVKAIDAVRQQGAITNARLEMLITEIQRRR